MCSARARHRSCCLRVLPQAGQQVERQELVVPTAIVDLLLVHVPVAVVVQVAEGHARPVATKRADSEEGKRNAG